MTTTVTATTSDGCFGLDFDGDQRVATLTMRMKGLVNKVNAGFIEGLTEAIDWALSRDSLAGVILASAHRDFCVGADIEMLYEVDDPRLLFERVTTYHRAMRRLETAGVPVVAALTGSALGGGYELALACHRRLVLDDPRVQLGLPEVSLGVIPGGGGTQRLPRLIGLQRALEFIAQGKTLRGARAVEAGLADQAFADPEALRAAALAWIAANPEAKQPWDDKRFRFPPPRPGSPEARDLLLAAAAMTYDKTAGAIRAPEIALSAVGEGMGLAFDRALEVEARYFTALATSPQAKDMIRTLWFHKQAADRFVDLPVADDPEIDKVGILGAGMMGAALAYVCAERGFQVVLKDIDQGAIDRANAHLDKLVSRSKKLDDAGRAALRARIDPTLELGRLSSCQLVIEAVFESAPLKHEVLAEVEPLLDVGGIWASNTSALPIDGLAAPAARPENFVGLHFFSPVERMALVEVIRGAKTDERTLGRALAFIRRLKKTPIVVEDGYGFYTTRVFTAYILEGAQLAAERHAPALIEWAARSAGMAVGPLQVFDEIGLHLGQHVLEGAGDELALWRGLEGVELVNKMVADGRKGRAAGAGFFDYRGGKRVGLWSGLDALTGHRPSRDPQPVEAGPLGRRLLLIQAVEAVRAIERGVITRHRDAEIGAVFGLGFAPNSGGPLSYLDRLSAKEAVNQLHALAEAHGSRYAPPALLVSMAEQGKRFFS